jgi:hypothetical protein
MGSFRYEGVCPEGTYDLVLKPLHLFWIFQGSCRGSPGFEKYLPSLRQGGSFVIEVMGKEVMAKDFEPITASKTERRTICPGS